MDKIDRRHSLTFTQALGILFIGLKLMGFIDWSWLWVLTPVWVDLGLEAVVLILKRWNRSLKAKIDALEREIRGSSE